MNPSPKNNRPTPTHLIGPAYYDAWWRTVKLVLLCTVIPVAAIAFLRGLWEGFTSAAFDAVIPAILLRVVRVLAAVSTAIAAAISGGISAFLGVFGAVTLIFAVLEYKQVSLPAAFDKIPDLKFQPKEQNAAADTAAQAPAAEATPAADATPQPKSPKPPAGSSKGRVSRVDSCIGIVVQVILAVLFLAAPEVFSFFCFDKSGDAIFTVPLLNLDAWATILPLLLVGLLAGLLDDVFQLIYGVWCRGLLLCRLVCSTVQAVCAVLLFRVVPLWNPDFAEQIGACPNASMLAAGTWDADTLSMAILAVLLLITVLDVVTALYKTLRYGSSANR